MDGIFVDSLRNGEVQTQPNELAMLRSQDENARQVMELSFRIARLERPVSTVWVARCDGQIVGALDAPVAHQVAQSIVIAVAVECQAPVDARFSLWRCHAISAGEDAHPMAARQEEVGEV